MGALAAQEALSAKGFEHFYSLEYDAAVAEFEKEAAARPNEPEPYNHLAQALLYRELYRLGALESELVTGANPFLRRAKMEPRPEELARFDDAIAKAMRFAQVRIDQKATDIRGLYALGVAYGLRGNCGFLIRKTYMSALRDATSARKLCNQVVEIDPSQYDARMVQGAHDYIVGSLPLYMRMLGFLGGIRGDKEGGIRTLLQVANKGTNNKMDAKILLGVIYRRERRPQEALPLLAEMVTKYPRNYLFRLEQSQMYADFGDKEKAAAILDDIDKLKRAGAPGYERISWEKLAFVKGNFRFWYDDFDLAIENLKLATAKEHDLDLNTGVMAWLRLGQAYDMKKQHALAKPAYLAAIRVAPQSEAAKEARRYVDAAYVRDYTKEP
ncbi:MAG: tetratricopeptide repeat protein [Bryobacteraceae bacterium]|nr:tetratricopeptide repeat protein [Bryobacteraceae bacterium]